MDGNVKYCRIILTALLISALGSVITALAGCQTAESPAQSVDRLLVQAEDRNLADAKRLTVFEELQRRDLTDQQKETFFQILSRIAASPLHSPLIRRQAGNTLFQRYSDQASLPLSEALLHTPEPDLQRQFLDAIQAAKDPLALPNLVLFLDQEEDSSNIRQDIIHAVEQISALPLQDLLWAMLHDPAQPLTIRLAALNQYQKHLGPAAVLDRLGGGIGGGSDGRDGGGGGGGLGGEENSGSSDPFLQEIFWWAGQFNYLPATAPRFFACRLLRLQLSPSQLDMIREASRTLQNSRSCSFDPPDAYLLLNLPVSEFPPQDVLDAEINSLLSRKEHVKRPPSYPGAPDDCLEDFAGQTARLGYTDRLRIVLILQMLRQQGTPEILYGFLQRNNADPQSETGGLCFLENRRVRWQKYPPGKRLGDNQFAESPDMLFDVVLSLARWHTHAHPEKTVELAGPGMDDLRMVRYYNSPLLVITRLRETLCNVDYVSPSGVVIDLGNY